MLSGAFVTLISLYQKYIRIVFMPSCRFEPSCSEYTKQAVKKYGCLRGVFKGAKRVLRCNAFFRASGYDPLL